MDTTSLTIENTLVDIFADFGSPYQIYCDNAQYFRSKSMDEFLTNWNINPMYGTPRYPQGQGHAENAIKRIKHLIAKYTADKVGPQGLINTTTDESDWFLHLKRAQLALNTRTNKTTKFSPFYLLFNHFPNQTSDVNQGQFPTYFNLAEHFASWNESRDLYDMVLERKEELNEQQNEYRMSKNLAMNKLNIGNVVLLRIENGPKGGPKMEGPYIVKGIINNAYYKLCSPHAENLVLKNHYSRELLHLFAKSIDDINSYQWKTMYVSKITDKRVNEETNKTQFEVELLGRDSERIWLDEEKIDENVVKDYNKAAGKKKKFIMKVNNHYTRKFVWEDSMVPRPVRAHDPLHAIVNNTYTSFTTDDVFVHELESDDLLVGPSTIRPKITIAPSTTTTTTTTTTIAKPQHKPIIITPVANNINKNTTTTTTTTTTSVPTIKINVNQNITNNPLNAKNTMNDSSSITIKESTAPLPTAPKRRIGFAHRKNMNNNNNNINDNQHHQQ